jgi:hypothetical protein
MAVLGMLRPVDYSPVNRSGPLRHPGWDAGILTLWDVWGSFLTPTFHSPYKSLFIVYDQDVVSLLVDVAGAGLDQVGMTARVALLAHRSPPLSNGARNLGGVGT